MMLMHVQYLKPGQVGYQAPGVLHAYLEGQNIELMANSDNVLRGGLTPKHIDPAELMLHLDTTSPGQCLLSPIYLMDDELAFSPPVHDFFKVLSSQTWQYKNYTVQYSFGYAGSEG
ncbi:MAG: hypothetical protein IPO69_17205 [Saprospiraceae bacterium]|nr:hypothetical protein [Saprospiraceae bacterium]